MLKKEWRFEPLNVLSLKEFKGRIYSLAKGQNDCRLLQGKFENPMNEEIEMVLYDVLDSIRELMRDQFGNYLIQKLITVCNDDHKLRILLSLTDLHVPYEMVLICKCYDVTTDKSGCCVLQACIEHSQGEVRTRLVAEILANAIHLAEDPYGLLVTLLREDNESEDDHDIGGRLERQMEHPFIVTEPGKVVRAGTVPGRGAAFVHLSTRTSESTVPAIKEKIEDAEERLGADIIQKALVAQASLVAQNAGVEGEVAVEKLQVLTTQAIVVEKFQPKTPAAAGAQQGGFSV
ncbi:pumilio homolog 12-like protein [Tanacetum coccineum]